MKITHQPLSILQPNVLTETQVYEFSKKIDKHLIASGVNGLCRDERCVNCHDTMKPLWDDYHEKRKGRKKGEEPAFPKTDPICEEGYTAVKKLIKEYRPSLTDYWKGCMHPSFKSLHPVLHSLNVEQIERPSNKKGVLFQTSKEYTLEKYGYEWVYVNPEHDDALTYRSEVAKFRDLFAQKVGTEVLHAYAKDKLFPQLKRIASKAMKCDSMHLVSQLGNSNEEVTLRAGKLEFLDIGLPDLHEGQPLHVQIKRDVPESFRFPVEDDKGGDKVGQELEKLEEDYKEEEEAIEEALDPLLVNLAIETPDEYFPFPIVGETLAQEALNGEVEVKDENQIQDGLLEIMGPGDEVESKEEIERKDAMGLTDILGSCNGHPPVPMVHVDSIHDVTLQTVYNEKKGKKGQFGKKLAFTTVYQEMWNVWVLISEPLCSQPLAFDKRENADGLGHSNDPSIKMTSDVVFSMMESGDFVMFRTLDVAHTALLIKDDREECVKLWKMHNGDCRVSVEFRAMSYGGLLSSGRGVISMLNRLRA